MENALTISDKALNQLKNLEVEGANFLRISVVPGGCSGMMYQAIIDNTFTPFDKVLYDENQIRVIADKQSALHLDGLEIDYSDDLIKAGFRFGNKKATKSCGCGSSFEV
jgi:iron-sulfur cluster assembly protein